MASASDDAPVLRLPTAGFAAAGIVREFPQARRGYDQEEVTAHLRRVADRVIELQSRMADLEATLRERESVEPQLAAARDEAYQETAERIADMVRVFDEHIGRMRADAESEIEHGLAEAREDADRIVAEAEETRTQAQLLADETLSLLESRRGALLENVRRIHDALLHATSAAAAVLQHGEVVVDDEATRTEQPGPPPA
jgi:DivIVA domain-containing protein